MNRRGVLKGLGAAAAAAVWPGWLSEAFAGAPCGVLKGAATLSAAIKRAHDALQPLLILVVPKDDGEKWDRGRHFGEWLNFGADRDLAPLACAQVVCSEMRAVCQLFPSAPADAEPAAFIAQVDRAPARIGIALDSFLPHEASRLSEAVDHEGLDHLTEAERQAFWEGRYERQQLLEDASIQPCIDRTGEAIRRAVLGDLASLRRLADARWERMTASDRDMTRRLLGGGSGSALDVVMAAPMLAVAAAERGGAEEDRLTKVLADAARAQFGEQRIPGSKWARASGCGEFVEGEEEQIGIACGMGHVPRKSQRFLYFFTRSPYLGGE
ncbi:MAG TPA: twin-arginine translocation signal domain-containing protein [Myxococcaceae bacterium]|jgi:hypothetical protein